MNNIEITKELLSFIQDSPSMFHSIKTIRTYLDKDGFTYLPEGKAWTVEKVESIIRSAIIQVLLLLK